MTMTIEQFRAHLAEIDRRTTYGDVRMSGDAPLFDCGARRISNSRFCFDFDGYLTCVIDFQEDGSVLEWQDANPDNPGAHGAPVTHQTIEAWISTSAKTLLGD